MTEQIFNAREAADYLNLGRRQVERYIETGKLICGTFFMYPSVFVIFTRLNPEPKFPVL